MNCYRRMHLASSWILFVCLSIAHVIDRPLLDCYYSNSKLLSSDENNSNGKNSNNNDETKFKMEHVSSNAIWNWRLSYKYRSAFTFNCLEKLILLIDCIQSIHIPCHGMLFAPHCLCSMYSDVASFLVRTCSLYVVFMELFFTNLLFHFILM